MAATVTAHLQAADGSTYDLVIPLPPVTTSPAQVRLSAAPIVVPRQKLIWNGTGWS